MIPRILHQVWIGDEMPEREQWLRSTVWELHPGWEIRLWRYDSILRDLPHQWSNAMLDRWNQIPSVCDRSDRVAAYRSDLLRLAIIWSVGGFYLDCDMFGVRPLDDLRDEPIVLMEFRKGQVGEGIIAAPPESERIALAIDHYLKHPPSRLSGLHLGPLARHHGWKTFDPEYFCPHPRMPDGPRNDLYRCTEKTYTIHCWRDHQYDRERLLAVRPEFVAPELVA